jgi:cell division protein ZapA (FtsZ GTPase activity inhibitor)
MITASPLHLIWIAVLVALNLCSCMTTRTQRVTQYDDGFVIIAKSPGILHTWYDYEGKVDAVEPTSQS